MGAVVQAPALYLLGQTGSGKHEVAMPLARRLGAEIVSVDSVKVYRGMDIGTAKPPAEWLREIPHHLIDVADPWDAYSAGRFVRDAGEAETAIRARGRLPLFVGGTALYYKAYRHGLFDGPPADAELRARLEERARREGVEALHADLARRDPEAASRIHPRDFKRIQRALEVHESRGVALSTLQTHFDAPPAREGRVFVLRRDDEDLRSRVVRRLDRMFEAGFLEEVRRLIEHPRGWSREPARSHAYMEAASHLRGGMTTEEARESSIRRTWRYTRRQRTWFRSFKDAAWIDVAPDETAATVADRVLARYTAA